ncbi:GGDEF domain-containing protein [Deinococcus aquatilis]|uniref:GGDEF domain-containing protein n=1 Tax=Deinococcus aquatilis TaxID=519440 RepID=UPI00035DCA94|nr:diguanylate cyclase [Deinococcus aquatilis]
MDLTGLALWALEGERFVPHAFSDSMPPDLQDQMRVGVLRGGGAIWDTLVGNAVYLEESTIPADLALGVRSVALVPLPASSQVVTQVLCAYRGGKARLWTVQERTLLETASRSIAAALERAALHQQAQEAAEYAQTLLAVSALVESPFEPSVMAQQVLGLLGSAMKLDWGSLLLVRGHHIEAMSTWGRVETEQGVQEQLGSLDSPGLQAQVRQVLKTGQALYIGHNPAQPPLSLTRGTEGVRSLAWIPLTDLNDTSYLFAVTRRHQAPAWSPRDQALLAAAARTVRIAFERQEHLRLIEQASLTDSLTGLANRRAFNGASENMGARSSQVFGLISIDIDGLKQVNDTLGHQWGDLLLQEFGEALQEQFREQDQVFRLGGDEYVVLLPACRPEQTQLMLDRVQRAADWVRRRPELQACGASAGMAFSPEDGHTLASLTNTADVRMYLNKKQRQQQRALT